VTAITCTLALPVDYRGAQTGLPLPTASILPSGIGTATTVWCKFTGNPGPLRKPDIVTLDSAGRSTVKSDLSTATAEAPSLAAYVVDLGVGSNVDYFGTYCGSGVTITTDTSTYTGAHTYSPMKSVTVSGTSADPLTDLQRCLGDSDGAAQAFGVEWDNGNSAADASGTKYPGQFPHLVKLVDATFNSYNAILYYDTAASKWKIVNHVPDGVYNVYATAGTLARTFQETTGLPSAAMTLYTSADLMAAVTTTAFSNQVTANIDISCKTSKAITNPASVLQVQNCIEKGSLVVIPSTLLGNNAADGFTNNGGTPVSGPLKAAATYATSLVDGNVYTLTANLYTVTAITSPGSASAVGSVITLDRTVPFSTLSIGSPVTFALPAPVFKFTPAPLNKGSYIYAGECSTRGLCNRETGICKCFKGYTNDNCDTQSALAM
jgi:hypothetical protein